MKGKEKLTLRDVTNFALNGKCLSYKEVNSSSGSLLTIMDTIKPPHAERSCHLLQSRRQYRWERPVSACKIGHVQDFSIPCFLPMLPPPHLNMERGHFNILGSIVLKQDCSVPMTESSCHLDCRQLRRGELRKNVTKSRGRSGTPRSPRTRAC